MHQDVVEYAPEGVLDRSAACSGNLYCFADGYAKAALVLRVLRQDAAARVGEVAGTGMDGGAVGFHHVATVGLLLIANFDHENFDVHTEVGTSQCQGRSPLPGACLSRDLLDAGLLVIVDLGDGGV